jgi:hypothetical protein
MNIITTKTRFVFSVLLLMGTMLACNTVSQPQYVVVTTTPISAISEAPDGKIGDQISTNDFNLTVLSVEEASSFENDTPKEGNKYVTVEIEIESRRDNYDVNPLYARLQDSNSNVYFLIFGGKDPFLEASYGMSKGAKVSGWITYEVPKMADTFLFIYQPWDAAQPVIVSLNK